MEGRMKKLTGCIVFLTVVCLSFNAFAAEKMKQATVEYSADMVLQSGQVSSTGKIYHALGGKDRMEFNAQGTTAITIVRTDKKLAWMLMPSQNMYMEMSLEESMKKSGRTNVDDCDMDFSAQGSETVNGVSAAKNRVSGTCPDNTKYEGTMWITKDNIMVKMDSVATVDGRQTNMTMDLKNLKVGPQDASLFEVPTGYSKFNMGDITSMIKAQSEAAKAQAEAEKAKADAEKANTAGREETGRAYTTSRSAASGTSDTTNPVDKVDNTADQTNKTLDTTEKVKGTINRLKGLLGK